MVTNLTNLTGAVTFYDIVEFNNDITGGILMVLFVIAMFFIMLNLFSNRVDFDQALLASSWISFGLSIILTSINLLPYYFMFIFGIFAAFAAVYIKLKS